LAELGAADRYLQSWDVPNVFVPGANAVPQNNGYNPAGMVGALSYWAAKAIREKYPRAPRIGGFGTSACGADAALAGRLAVGAFCGAAVCWPMTSGLCAPAAAKGAASVVVKRGE
jgi:hypothetical protein